MRFVVLRTFDPTITTIGDRGMRTIIAATAAALAIAACGHDGDVRPAKPGEAKPATTSVAPEAGEESNRANGSSWGDAVEFVDAIDQGDYTRARSFTGEGTWADKYVIHQEPMDKAVTAAGWGGTGPGPGISSDEKAGTVTRREGIGQYTSELVYSNFSAENGKLAAFEVNEKPLAARLWTQPAEVEKDGVKFRLVSAYLSGAGSVDAVVDITAGDKPLSVTGEYVDGAGRQFDVLVVGVTTLNAGATGAHVFRADGAEFGGTLSIDVLDAETWESIGSVKMAIR
jgi:hypothetical protein